MKWFRKNYLLILLVGIFLWAGFLRFWKVPELFFFGIDEEYQAHLAWSIVKDFHVIWIGLSAANTGFYVGPGFTYLNALLFWISKGDPIILGYFSSLLGCITLIALYCITKDIFNRKVAIIATALYGFSHFVVMYDRRFWNSTFVPLIVILMFYSLVKGQKKSWWYLLTVFLMATAFHIHASLFLLIPLLIFVLVKKFSERKYKVNFKLLIPSILILIGILSPLIVYDFVHNFDNLKTPLRMLHSANQGPKFSFTQHISMFVETIGRSLYANANIPLQWILGVMGITWLVFFLQQKKNSVEKILAYFVITYIFGLLLYPGLVLEYYYIGFMPIFFLVMSLFIEKLPLKAITGIILIFAVVNSCTLFQTPTTGGLKAQKEFVRKTSIYLREKDFYLDTHEPYLYFGGWKYLFDVYGKKPAKSKADEMFGWIYQDEIVEKPTKTKVLISGTDIIPEGRVIRKVTAGPYRSYILIDNAN